MRFVHSYGPSSTSSSAWLCVSQGILWDRESWNTFLARLPRASSPVRKRRMSRHRRSEPAVGWPAVPPGPVDPVAGGELQQRAQHALAVLCAVSRAGTAALAGRRPCLPVVNDRLRHTLIGSGLERNACNGGRSFTPREQYHVRLAYLRHADEGRGLFVARLPQRPAAIFPVAGPAAPQPRPSPPTPPPRVNKHSRGVSRASGAATGRFGLRRGR